jgi:hypothetical protein
VEHDIIDPADALGPRPEQHEEQCDWERAHEALARDQRERGRDVEVELDIDRRLSCCWLDLSVGRSSQPRHVGAREERGATNAR